MDVPQGHLARDIAGEFRNQYPALAADIVSETGNAVDAPYTDAAYSMHYDDFVFAMVYGERRVSEDAMATVAILAAAAVNERG